MRCEMCFVNEASMAVEMYYVWSRDNPEKVWHVCEECWQRGKNNPAMLGPRRDRKVKAYSLQVGRYRHGSAV